MNAPLAVSLEGVSKSYGGRAVLAGLDLVVDAGSILVVLGPSGVGKSTVLRLLAGLEDADAGRIRIGDQVVADPRSRVPAHRRGVGMVFQSLELWPHMTVAENVAFGLPGRPRGHAALGHARVAEVADAVGLPPVLLARRPPTLSGGERQRVAIARALAPAPGVLLYDEPLAHLDPSRRAEIRRLVRAVGRASSTTILYVTHDAAEALEVGDRVAILGEGRVLEAGAPSDVYAHPSTLAGARALGAVSVFPAQRRPGGGYESALGTFAAPARLAAARALLLVRPEQVHLGRGPDGAPAEVVDTFAVPGGFSFTARLRTGESVEGRSPERPNPGSSVRVGVTGPAALVVSSEPPSEDPSR